MRRHARGGLGHAPAIPMGPRGDPEIGIADSCVGQLLAWTGTRAATVVFDSDREEGAGPCGLSRVASLVQTQEDDVFGVYHGRPASPADPGTGRDVAPEDDVFFFATRLGGRALVPQRWLLRADTEQPPWAPVRIVPGTGVSSTPRVALEQTYATDWTPFSEMRSLVVRAPDPRRHSGVGAAFSDMTTQPDVMNVSGLFDGLSDETVLGPERHTYRPLRFLVIHFER